MKIFSMAVVFAVASGPLLAVEMGNTYEKVVDEMGVPVSKMEVGGASTLNYPDSTIVLRDGAVVSIKMVGVESGDTYRKVIEVKGMPASKIEAGVSAVLRYADATIKLREGKVVSIKMSGVGQKISVDVPGPDRQRSR